MPAARQRARRTTLREVLDTAIELEKKTMALYVAFVKRFGRPDEVRNFWFTMARHEASHCGALSLVEANAPVAAPALKGFRQTGDLALVDGRRKVQIPAGAKDRAAVDRFFAACGAA